jgi:hypothetical protein
LRAHVVLTCHASFFCTTAEEAQKHVRGLEENAVHVKYIELVRAHRCLFAAPGFRAEYSQFAEFKRMEREHQKEKQKLLKDKDAGTFMSLFCPHSHADTSLSQKPTHKG